MKEDTNHQSTVDCSGLTGRAAKNKAKHLRWAKKYQNFTEEWEG